MVHFLPTLRPKTYLKIMRDIASIPCNSAQLPSLDDPGPHMMSEEVARHGEMSQGYRGEVDRGAASGGLASDHPCRFGLIGARRVPNISRLEAIYRMEGHERDFLGLHASRDGRAACERGQGYNRKQDWGQAFHLKAP